MNLKIISFCNYPYREIALNWVKHLEALSIDNYEVLCLDAESDEYLKFHGCHSRVLDEFNDDNSNILNNFDIDSLRFFIKKLCNFRSCKSSGFILFLLPLYYIIYP